MKNLLLRTASLLIAAALLMSLCSCGKTDYSPESTVMTSGEVEMVSLFPYTGTYVEDGSDGEVNGIAAVTVKNDSGKAWQLLSLEVMAGEETYNFTVTALMPGMTLTALERDKKTLPADAQATYFGIIQSGEYAAVPSVHEDMFEAQVYNGIMNLKNITDKDMENNVFVYYKNKDASGFFGGITYRVNFGKLKGGELSQRPSAHLKQGNSEILFITYGE